MFILRERERKREGEREREYRGQGQREEERESQVDFVLSMEPDMGLHLITHDLKRNQESDS